MVIVKETANGDGSSFHLNGITKVGILDSAQHGAIVALSTIANQILEGASNEELFGMIKLIN